MAAEAANHPETAHQAIDAAIQANAVTAVYGLSGAGKSSLVDTAAEYVWERFQKITRIYASDLGGWGNKRLSLIRLGIIQVWYIRNHKDAFETMEFASMGYWPEKILDPETGFAAPDVKLIAPRRTVYSLVCPNGHVAKKFDDQRLVAEAQVLCPQCQQMVTAANATRIDRQTIRSAGFGPVGAYAYDSGTALNDWAMSDLAERGARGELGGEGAALDKVVSGSKVFGMNNRAHYGFSQARTQGWIANVRAIPDMVIPPVMTFLEETGTDEGGRPIHGPKIAGSAKTAELPAWVGNCLHAERVLNEHQQMAHRLWLGSHISPNDARAIPYLAKHRGEPLDMPLYLEDGPEVEGGPIVPWSQFSLKYLFNKLDDQFIKIQTRDRLRFANAPALAGLSAEDTAEEVIEEESQTGAQLATATAGPAIVPGGGRQLRRPRGRGPITPAPAAPSTEIPGSAPPSVTPAVAGSPVGRAAGPAAGEAAVGAGSPAAVAESPAAVVATPSPIQRQLEQTLVAAGVTPVTHQMPPAAGVPAAAAGTATPAAVSPPPAVAAVTAPVTSPVTPVSSLAPPQPIGGNRSRALRRTPKPPV